MVVLPIVESEVDEETTMPVTSVSVEMATGPPAPPAPPAPPEVLCKVLASLNFIQSSKRLTDPEPDPEPDPLEAFPVVDVTVTVPVAEVTVAMAVVLALKPPAAARTATQEFSNHIFPRCEHAGLRREGSYTYRNSILCRMPRRQTLEQHHKLGGSSREDHSQS
jgi:hypothetical protein